MGIGTFVERESFLSEIVSLELSDEFDYAVISAVREIEEHRTRDDVVLYDFDDVCGVLDRFDIDLRGKYDFYWGSSWE